jgi:hypothetical protein
MDQICLDLNKGEKMKTDYKHIYFEKSAVVSIPQVWLCKNKKSKATLAQLYCYQPWRQYVFAPLRNAVFNDSCLKDIINFLEQLNKKHE